MTLVDLFDVMRLVGLAVLVLAFGTYLAMTAGRLDRLHVRLDAAYASLELQFALRAEAIAETMANGVIDPVSQDLLDRALAARRGGSAIQVVVESEISALLREVVEAHDGTVAEPELQQELRSACNRVELALGFYNDAVDAALAMRDRWLVRTLGLAGYTALPERIRCDAASPEFEEPPLPAA